MKPVKQIIALLLLLHIFSCGEQPIDWEFSEGDLNKIIIDGIITNENKRQSIKLSRPFKNPNQKPEPVTGASVTVYDSGVPFDFIESPEMPGTYVNEIQGGGIIGRTYFLEVNYDGKQYLARAKMPAVFVYGHITFQHIPDTDSMMIAALPASFSENEQAMYEINIDWSHLVDTGKTETKVFAYTFNTVDISQVFQPEKETVVFPFGSYVVVKKYSLSPEHGEFLRALVAETEWQGGVFSETSGNLPSNISDGGLGFFGACAVLSDTLIAQ